jgi:hypothetical protein
MPQGFAKWAVDHPVLYVLLIYTGFFLFVGIMYILCRI